MMDDCCDIPAPQPTRRYFPDEIILYGVPLDAGTTPRSALISFAQYMLSLQVLSGTAPVGASTVAIAVIYGYSYEGHCYRFDKPRLMVFEASPLPASGCGFEPTTSSGTPPVTVPGYYMWSLYSKNQIILELNATVDEAETIVLTNNLPGRRSPNTFSASMQLAHRGGRLTNGGST
jgi:hypothetical protein